MKDRIFATILLLVFTLQLSSSESQEEKSGKALSIFNVVRFRNEPCAGSAAKNGTCYTSQECEQRAGTASGTCAEGYGVCCLFTIGCGATTNENCTYFESGTETLSAGDCTAKICRTDSDICFLRLDMTMFTISGPTTAGGGAVTTAFGVPSESADATGLHSFLGSCSTDSFTATNPGGSGPPTVCGTLTGDHMFVEASNPCNELMFQFGSSATTGVTRQFSIKVSQLQCNSGNLPPKGCTQYFTSDTGTIQSFNFNNGQSRHLSNQNQNICVRRTRGMCAICYSPGTITTDFMVSHASTDATGTFNNANLDTCCNYATIKGTKGYDCVIIPSAMKMNAGAVAGALVGGSAFCGNKLVTKQALNGINNTVCSRREPFNIRFIADNTEAKGELLGNTGFRLNYFQVAC